MKQAIYAFIVTTTLLATDLALASSITLGPEVISRRERYCIEAYRRGVHSQKPWVFDAPELLVEATNDPWQTHDYPFENALVLTDAGWNFHQHIGQIEAYLEHSETEPDVIVGNGSAGVFATFLNHFLQKTGGDLKAAVRELSNFFYGDPFMKMPIMTDIAGDWGRLGDSIGLDQITKLRLLAGDFSEEERSELIQVAGGEENFREWAQIMATSDPTFKELQEILNAKFTYPDQGPRTIVAGNIRLNYEPNDEGSEIPEGHYQYQEVIYTDPDTAERLAAIEDELFSVAGILNPTGPIAPTILIDSERSLDQGARGSFRDLVVGEDWVEDEPRDFKYLSNPLATASIFARNVSGWAKHDASGEAKVLFAAIGADVEATLAAEHAFLWARRGMSILGDLDLAHAEKPWQDYRENLTPEEQTAEIFNRHPKSDVDDLPSLTRGPGSYVLGAIWDSWSRRDSEEAKRIAEIRDDYGRATTMQWEWDSKMNPYEEHHFLERTKRNGVTLGELQSALGDMCHATSADGIGGEETEGLEATVATYEDDITVGQ